jgi:hypothetical protein
MPRGRIAGCEKMNFQDFSACPGGLDRYAGSLFKFFSQFATNRERAYLNPKN